MAFFFHDNTSIIFDGENPNDTKDKLAPIPLEQFSKAVPVPGHVITKPIGAGQFAYVYHGFDSSNNEKRAYKYTQKAMVDKSMQREFEIYKTIDNPFFIKYYSLIMLDQFCVFVMDHCKYGNLDDLIKEYLANGLRIAEKRILGIIFDLISGLSVLHDLRLVHRNIKPMNIFLSPDGHLKFGGMETGKLFYSTLSHTKESCWILYYTAPELIISRSVDSTKEGDIWSIGIILHQLIRLQLPFGNSSQIVSYLTPDLLPGLPPGYSSKLQSLCDSILICDKTKRPSAKTLLSHPAFSLLRD